MRPQIFKVRLRGKPIGQISLKHLSLSDYKGLVFKYISEIYDFEYFQYTGTKDKNGIEVFEVDKIKGKFDMGPGGFVDFEWIVSFHLIEGYQWNFWDLKTIEVIK